MSKRKTTPPFVFKNKVETAKLRNRANLQATSKITGIQHTFGNIQGWESVITDLEQKAILQTSHMLGSLNFSKWLQDQKIDLNHCCINYQDIGFRYAHPNFGPQTIVGSLIHGGRFNIGGAQLNTHFPSFTAFGCLYVASSEECATEEAAKPIGGLKLYKIKPKQILKLWDLQKVIASLDFVNLIDLVRASHGEKIWGYQKFPTEPQILAYTLKLLGGDGLIFESTKSNGHSNIAFFFDNDEDIKKTMDVM